MKIEINSTWHFANIDGFTDGDYRVLAVESRFQSLIVFQLENSTKIIRPALMPLTDFQSVVAH